MLTFEQLREAMLKPGAKVRLVGGPGPTAYPTTAHKSQGTSYAEAEKMLATYREVYNMASTTQLLDIHTITAAMIHHVPYSQVTKEQRQQAKGMNYFWLYQPGTFYEPPERDKLFAIYTPAEIKQLQVDLKWDGSEDLYESIKRFFQPVK